MPDFSTLRPPAHSLCKLEEITTAEVQRLISDSSTKQYSLDFAPVRLLKSLTIVPATILAILINVSIAQSSRPAKQEYHHSTSCKETGICPHDLTDPASNRLIWNLSFISKLVERIIHKNLSDYVESQHPLPPTQSGFRRHHCTETAVIKVYNDFVLALDLGFSTAPLLLDISAAFDCVDHTILLKILQLACNLVSLPQLCHWSLHCLRNCSQY